MIKVLVNGAKGKMGSETVRAVENESDLELVAQLDQGDNLKEALSDLNPDVAVDFTHPDCVKSNILTLLDASCRPVVGTTGLSETDLKEIGVLAQEKACGVAICPNFAIGAILMMRFAQEAAHYLPRVEIVEYHHDKKADAPSGTAIKTAQMIKESYAEVNAVTLDEKELIAGSRGGTCENIPIHSVRVPGYVASQEVIFGGVGQTLKIRHDTISRDSFMPGVVIAIRKVMAQNGLVYGLEKLL